MSAFFAAAAAQWRALRTEYQDILENQYARAETETNGTLLNARGKAKGIDPFSLFSGPAIRAYAYASEELVEHWTKHTRMTYADYERQMQEEWR